MRYQHRISIDIDFISPYIIGKKGFGKIISELDKHFGSSVMKSILINEELGEQYLFLRTFITAEKEMIKVEFLQNMKCLYKPEIVDGIRMIHKNDIGLFKLMSATNRFAKKDIYDLDFITNQIPLTNLYHQLSEKRDRYHLPEHQSLFDLDIEKHVLEHPDLLLNLMNLKNPNPTAPHIPTTGLTLLKAGKVG